MEYIKKNIGLILIITFIVVFMSMVFAGAKQINDEAVDIKSNCPRTNLVVLGGRNGTPRWVYDCTDVELESLKR